MDVIIVCHTEYGYVKDKIIIFDKFAHKDIETGVSNLSKIAKAHGAKVTYAIMPEVVKHFPNNTNGEIGLHIHPGWNEYVVIT